MRTSVQIGLTIFLVVGLGAATHEAGTTVAIPPNRGARGLPDRFVLPERYRSGVAQPSAGGQARGSRRSGQDPLRQDHGGREIRSVLAGFQGPNGITLHSPRIAEIDQRKNDYLRFESRLGRRHYEVAILVTARELNHQFEWAAHEPAALKAGVEPAVIDIIKYKRPLVGLQPKDAALIQLGREVIGLRSVQPATLAEALKLFGRQDLVDAVSVMAHYAGIAILLDAFNQQLAPGQKPLLPPL